MGAKIVMLGSGNVATCMAPALSRTAEITQIYSPTLEHCTALASAHGATATDDLSKLVSDADFYIIAVKDDAVAGLVEALRNGGSEAARRGIWCHTSGSQPLEVLDGLGEGRSVFYPLQTFTAGEPVDASSVTMLLEADSPDTLDKVRRLASTFTSRIHEADSEQRRRIHVAAVFASNFANYMWTQAGKILEADGFDLGLLAPLIKATLRKALAIGPQQGQTGPARRGDTTTMNKHIAMLAPHQAELYKCISDAITSDYSH